MADRGGRALPELLEIDGVDLRGQGFGAATRTGRYNLPSRRGENLVLAGASGSRFVKNKPFEEGLGALACWAIGATTDAQGRLSIPSTFSGQRAAFEANMNKLLRLFTRAHKLSTIRAAQPDGSVRRALVEWTEWSEPEVMAGGTRAEFGMGFVIPGVWWEDESATTQDATANATLPKTLDLTFFTGMTGVIDDAVLTVTGPITNPRITEEDSGAYVEYTGTLTAGQTWQVNVASALSMVNSASVMASTKHAGSYKLLVIPNCYGITDTPRLTLSGSAGGAATNLSVTARRKWANG